MIMSRSLWIEKSTERTYRSVEQESKIRIKSALSEVAECEQPSEHSKVKLLEGPRETVYRLRVGDFRVVFTTDKRRLKVWRLGRRKAIYDGINNTYDKISA